MLAVGRQDDAELSFIRIYSSYSQYNKLPMNKTIDLSDVCTQIARLRYSKGDLADSLQFYREAEDNAIGENIKKDLHNTIELIEQEMTRRDSPAQSEIKIPKMEEYSEED